MSSPTSGIDTLAIAAEVKAELLARDVESTKASSSPSAASLSSAVAPAPPAPPLLSAEERMHLQAVIARRMVMVGSSRHPTPTMTPDSITYNKQMQILNEEQRLQHRHSMIDLAASPVAASAAVSAHNISSRDDIPTVNRKSRRKPNFADKLHTAISARDNRMVLAWLPSGNSFCILDQQEFAEKILPRYFSYCKFESFTRRLKRWGFRKMYTTDAKQSIYSHDVFHRDRPDLCELMNGKEKEPEDDNNVEFDPIQQEQYHHMMLMAQQQRQQAIAIARHQEAAARALAMRNYQMGLQMQKQQRVAAQLNEMARVQQVAAAQIAMSRESQLNVQGVTRAIDPSRMSMMEHVLTSTYGVSGMQARYVPKSNHFNNGNCGDDTIEGRGRKKTKSPQMSEAKKLLSRLNDDIESCEEQLAILFKLKKLKEKRRELETEVLSAV
jgi:hypothetical protein